MPEVKVWRFCRLPFRHSNNAANLGGGSSTSQQNHLVADHQPSVKVASVVKSFLRSRRRLSLDPQNKFFFPYEPGKQVKGAIKIKNISKTHVAFKFQTTAPRSCYMRPPGGILAPDQSLIATVFKFVEPPRNKEKLDGLKSRVKFKVMSLKVNGDMDYIPELFDEQRDQVAVEQILRVVFLKPDRPCPALEKLNRQLAEAEAELEARKKPPKQNNDLRILEKGHVLDEWKERRQRYLARQQLEAS